ncbi:L-xylulose reductase-like [Drosophila miranda]|uniref:L-xylulose reductase-like n=1 Tax=Drosophila miranda TaxID=7229 RepID=UPI00143F3C35|nr:L-xylulose reductase-like [Drosophila miranda]
MWADLKNKVILVTGAGAGIGQALVKELAGAGATVIAVARSEAQLKELAAFDPKHIQPLQLDLAEWQPVREALAKVPLLDGLVNNAGVVLTKMGRDNWSDPGKSGPLLAHIPLNRFCEVQEVVDATGYH